MNGFEILDHRFRTLALPNARLEMLAIDCRGLEGPVWFADHDCLYISDLPDNRVLRWSEHGGLSVFRDPSGFANGHARDRQGRLLTCSHLQRCISRTETDGTITILASHFRGVPLNAPSDVVCKSDGTIWFSDPLHGISTDYEGGKATPQLPASLYCLDAETGAPTHVGSGFDGPKGLAFSPDERHLYVAETGGQFDAEPRQHIRRFDVAADGTLSGNMVFHKIKPGFADGVCVDEQGNLWAGAADGVHCISPEGTLLGKILVPCRVSDLCFGGRHRSRLFLCCADTLFAIYTNTRGATLL